MRGITIFVAAAAFVRLAEPAHGASHVAIIYETPEWVGVFRPPSINESCGCRLPGRGFLCAAEGADGVLCA